MTIIVALFLSLVRNNLNDAVVFKTVLTEFNDARKAFVKLGTFLCVPWWYSYKSLLHRASQRKQRVTRNKINNYYFDFLLVIIKSIAYITFVVGKID